MNQTPKCTVPIFFVRLSRLTAVLIILFLTAAAAPAGQAGRKRVLILFSENKYLPGNALVEQAARNVLQQSGYSLEFYAEYLDEGRFPGENYYQVFRQYLQEKYAQRPPDLILAFLTRHFELAGELPAELFSKVPVVFGALTNDEVPRKGLGANVTGVAARIDAKGAIGIILKVQPETQRIVVVGGTAPLDRLFLGLTEKAVRLLPGHVQFDFWTTRPMSEIIQNVAVLPSKTAILFTNMFRDIAGETFLPEQAASSIAAAASVPVYAMIEPTVGSGVIGGKVTPFGAAGRRVGELAQRVLTGIPAASLPIESLSEGIPIFDGRALRRWRISESRLPPGSIVRFRQPSMWEQYKWYILGTTLVIAVQAILIMGLLLLRARRRRAESELRESEERMSIAADSANLGIWAWDITQDDIWATEKCRALYGIEPSAAIHFQTFLDTLHRDDRKRVRDAIQQAFRDKRYYSEEYRVVLPEGDIRWISAAGRGYYGTGGEPMRMLGVSTDITDRKRAEEKFRLAVEASPGAIAMVNEQGEIILVNLRTEKLFGYAPNELIGQPVELLIPERFRDVHVGHRTGFFSRPQAREMGADGNLFARRKNGTEFLVEIGLNPIQTNEGMLVLTVIVDITERKRTESQLQQHREELAHLTRVSTVGELTASIAHELNQPLGAILSNAEAAEMFLAAEPPALAEVRDILADIRKDDQRASEVIRRIRSLLRKNKVAPQAVRITDLLEDSLKLLRIDASARGVTVSLKNVKNVPKVWCDPVQLQQVLLNVALNGMDAMANVREEERQIIIQARYDGNGMVTISISDSGPGIRTEQLPELFEPFFTTKKDGMGMGLSIARTLVEAHGGRMWAENNATAGATFYFTVPIATEISA